MLRSLKELKGYVLKAEDGDIGRCHDFLLDDQTWTVRYMVADTGKWLPGRRVLISPIALGEPDWHDKRFPVRLTTEQIEGAPDLDEHAPVTRQYEIWYHQHYGWPFYWSGSEVWAMGVHPSVLYEGKQDLGEQGPDLERPHVHSAHEVMGYDVQASDGPYGQCEDFIVDDETWTVRYAVLSTRKWLPGKSVLVPMTELEKVVWDERALAVGLPGEKIKGLPEYDPSAPVNRELEERIYDFVGRPLE